MHACETEDALLADAAMCQSAEETAFDQAFKEAGGRLTNESVDNDGKP